MADTSDFRNGLTMIWKDDLWTIIEFQHVKPGKGPAFVRCKLRSVRKGKVVDNTFRSGEKIEIARVERHGYQYLYSDDLGYHFMHIETFEQTSVPGDLVKGSDFLKESSNVEILIYVKTGEAIAVDLPKHVELAVTQTDPGLKGDTAQGGTKPATLESGAVINVPLFVNEGDVLKVDVESRSYLTRV